MINSKTGSNDTRECATYLKEVGLSKADIAIHLWGINGLLRAPTKCVPDDIKKLIREFIEEQQKENESIDPIDKKIYKLQTELLYCMIKKRLGDQIELLERENDNVDSSISNEGNR